METEAPGTGESEGERTMRNANGNGQTKDAKRVRRDGFTVTEVLVAIALFAFLILPLFALFSGSIRQTAFGEDYLQASLLAQEEIEAVKYMASLSKTSLKDLSGAMNGERSADDGRFRVKTTVKADSTVRAKAGRGPVEAKVAEVAVEVAWNDASGKPHKVTLATLVDRVRY